MDIAETNPQLAEALARWRRRGLAYAFVPTMGALHAGHLALVRAAGARAGRVVASVFVHPTQFDRAGDLAAYPRQAAADADLLRAAGADVLYLPREAEVYPPGYRRPPGPDLRGLDRRFEGARRPGHFDGVVEVVRRLVTLVTPAYLYLGRKDAQQLAVLRRAAAAEAWPVEVVGVATVREADGLAMSSRNALLPAPARARAPALYAALTRLAAAYRGGGDPDRAAALARRRLTDAGFEPEYIEIVRARDFAPTDAWDDGRPAPAEALAIAAAWLGGVRLIDNVPVGEDPRP